MQKIAELSAHSGSIYALCEGEKEHLLYSGGGDGQIGLWSLKDFSPQAFSVKCDSPIYSLFFIKNKNLLCIGTGKGELSIINSIEKKEIYSSSLHNGNIFCLHYTEENNLLFSGSSDGKVMFWNLNDFKVEQILSLSNEKIRCLKSIGKYLLVGTSGGELIQIEISSGAVVNRKTTHKGGLYSMVVASDSLLYTSGMDGLIKTINLDSFSIVSETPAHNFSIYSMTESPNGTKIASSSRDKSIKIWEKENLSFIEKMDFKSHFGHKNSVNILLWHSFRNYLISAGDDKKIMVWETVL